VFDGLADPGLGLEAVRGEGVTLDVQDAQGAVRDQDRGRGDRAAGGCRSRKVRAPLPGAWEGRIKKPRPHPAWYRRD
jgi:hypothetical protein